MNEETPASIYTICRTCLSNLQEDEFFDLFVVPDLAKKLCVCTSLSVEHLDGLPRNLCTSCHSRLNDLHDFRKQCVESVQRFKELVISNNISLQSNPTDSFEELPDPLLHTKIDVNNEKDVFKMLEDVDKESEDIDNLEDAFNDSGSDYNNEDADFQVDSSDSDDEMPLSRLQSKARATKTKTKKRDEEHKSSEPNDADDPKEKPKRKRIPATELHLQRFLECHVCRKRFKKKSCYEEHIKHHNDQLPFQCTVETCKQGFTQFAGLRHHMDHKHPELCERTIACTIAGCNESFPRNIMLTNHLKKVHKILKPEARRHACTECDKVFRNPTVLKKHMYKHTGEAPPIACNLCDRRFHMNCELRDHLLRHAGVKNHVCPHCGVGKTTKQEWKKHILTHTREKQFQCRQCDHASHNQQALANHVKVVHMKIKNFACQYCGRIFGKSHACKVHERLHTGENCCKCKICGKVFLFEKRLTKHLQEMHKGDAKGDADKELTEPIDMKNEPRIPVKRRAPAKPKKSRNQEKDQEEIPKIKLNNQRTKNYEQYQDPAAERAAAAAELMAQQQGEIEAKRRAEEKARKIQEAACEELQKLQQQQISYDSFAE
ncbi:zinc finger protein 616-like [Drosophila innubila]|uniref:zinc finger protein 616-like n=1 Tax=Drosophila innubila TaxID=198719 RepID=UPI00148CFE05|nr:zinc finger protein 616-like [Drosophila innubila]